MRILPAEWHPQSGIQLTWPHSETDWNYMLAEVEECYLNMAREIATREKLLIVAPDTNLVRSLIEQSLPANCLANISYANCPTNDTWARDHGFITVIEDGTTPLLLDFKFNGWGDKFEASLDNAINKQLADNNLLQGTYEPHLDFVLEGGSIESDGEGTLLTTSECLLSKFRNPAMNKEQIEEYLKQALGSTKVLWLDHGALQGDDTDSHIDTLARLCPSNVITYVKCSDKSDPHYDELAKMEEQLKTFTNSKGEPFRLIALPMADAIFAIPPGETEAERLPATYANFLIMDNAVLLPTYRQPANDKAAHEAMQDAFPGYEIVDIDCTALVKQHGSLHCSTMQFPKL